jgi:hypothetical protein
MRESLKSKSECLIMAIVDLKMEKAIESFELHKSDQKE